MAGCLTATQLDTLEWIAAGDADGDPANLRLVGFPVRC
jgi:hypothetical protein